MANPNKSKWMSKSNASWFWLLLISGIICFIGGFVALFTNSFSIGMNLRYQQPAILDGSIFILIGIGFLLGAYHTFKRFRW